MKKEIKMVLAFFICAVQLIPIYIAFTVSLKGSGDASSFWMLTANPFWINYVNAFVVGKLFGAFINTSIITFGSSLLVVIIGSMSAYPLARNASKLNRSVNTFILSIMMIPGLSLLVPLYVLMVKFHAVSTYWGIIPVHVVFNLPLAIYMYGNFVRTIPRELDESALIDGCSIYAVFFRIVLPLLKPVTVSVLILTSMNVWNDYQYSLYFLQKPSIQVLTLKISSFFAQSGSDPHLAAAAAILSIIPVTIVYLILQKHFVKGLLEGSIK